MRLLLQWILTAIALLIVSRIVPGFHVKWAMARADCRVSHRTPECDRRPAPEDHHLPLSILTLGCSFWSSMAS